MATTYRYTTKDGKTGITNDKSYAEKQSSYSVAAKDGTRYSSGGSPISSGSSRSSYNGGSSYSNSPSYSSGGSSSGNKSNGSTYQTNISNNNNTFKGGGYAYVDQYGFPHVVSDYKTAQDYAKKGTSVYQYDGKYGGGYALDNQNYRIPLNLPGAQMYGNIQSASNNYYSGYEKSPYTSLVNDKYIGSSIAGGGNSSTANALKYALANASSSSSVFNKGTLSQKEEEGNKAQTIQSVSVQAPKTSVGTVTSVKSNPVIEAFLRNLGKAQADYQAAQKNRDQAGMKAASQAGAAIRSAAAAYPGGKIDLSKYGTANQYGRDYTQYYTGAKPAAASPVNAAPAQAVQAAQQGATAQTVQQPPVDEVILQQIFNELNAPPVDPNAVVQDFLSRLPQMQAPPVLSYDQAAQQAANQLNPLYAENLKNALEQVRNNAIRTGFFGQLPATALEATTAADVETRKAAAIAELAQQLVGRSMDDARQVQAMAMQQRGQEAQILANALQMAQQQNQERRANALNILNLLDNRKQQQWQRGMAEKQFEQDSAVQDAQLTGNYVPAEVQNLVSAILAAKQGWGSADANQRNALATQAAQARNQLTANYRINADKLFGPNVTLAQALSNAQKLYTPTLSKQQADREQQWRMVDASGLLPNGQKTWNRQYQEGQLGIEAGRLDLANQQFGLDQQKFAWAQYTDREQIALSKARQALDEKQYQTDKDYKAFLKTQGITEINAKKATAGYIGEALKKGSREDALGYIAELGPEIANDGADMRLIIDAIDAKWGGVKEALEAEMMNPK